MKYDTSYSLNEQKNEILIEGVWRKLGSTNPKNLKVSFLILDYNKPQETVQCINSIITKTRFLDYEIVLFSNGGDQRHVHFLYSKGLIDRLILNKENVGCGIATHELFKASRAPYSIYVQNDHILSRDFLNNELEELIYYLDSYSVIDLSGGAGHNDKYSERAHIIKTKTYLDFPIKGYGGPGPYEEWLWSEAGASYSIWNFNHKIKHDWPILFGNTGFRTVREARDGIILERYYV